MPSKDHCERVLMPHFKLKHWTLLVTLTCWYVIYNIWGNSSSQYFIQEKVHCCVVLSSLKKIIIPLYNKSFVFSARLDKVDIDSNSFTSQELKEALAKLKENEKTKSTMEVKVFFIFKAICVTLV